MYIKIHKTPEREILAVCDEDIVGKTFQKGEFQIIVSENFYKGEKVSDQEALDLIKNYENINIVGKRIVKLSLDNEIITEEHIVLFGEVPHAQIYQI